MLSDSARLFISTTSRHFLAILLLRITITLMALKCQVEAQDSQVSGFITLDCGLPAGSSYVDEETGIEYISDEGFVDGGVGASISPAYNTSGTKPWLQTLRSFPEGHKNCYTFAVEIGTQYLVRATFKYGDYDGRNDSPLFSFLVDNAYLGDIREYDPASVVSKEIIMVTTINYLFFCLFNRGSWTSFISLLELRPLKDSPYNTSSGSLLNVSRVDFGSTTSGVVSHPDDVLGRLWEPKTDADWITMNTSETINSQDCFSFLLPSSILRTASSPKIGNQLDLTINGSSNMINHFLHVYLCFAEIEKLGANESRQFLINSNQNFNSGLVSPNYLRTSIVYFSELIYTTPYTISLTKTIQSTLPPAINAIEVYKEIDPFYTHMDGGEADAMMKIKLAYGVKKNWQGDPCNFDEWDGVTCYDSSSDAHSTVKALNLSFSHLVGAITADISELTTLETLDLSNNNLTGHVPEFIAQMPFLKILNLAFNKLNGSVPPSLIEKSDKNLLIMSLVGNPDLCLSSSCNSGNNGEGKNTNPIVTAKTNKKSLIVFLVLGSVAAALMSALISIIIFRSGILSRRFTAKKKGKEACDRATTCLELTKGKKGRFTYSQLLAITNNLKVVLGHGGSGTVYHGYLHGNEVAVKVLFPSSAQGYKQFQAEVDILLRVHHGNLLSLVGYCDENNNMGLIYEYMANGNLQEYISSCTNSSEIGSNESKTLSWEQRLKIAVGAAQGLEYLHNGCEPQIVHRDVKTANILLNEKLLAKLADFGLSRSFPPAGASHLFTDVAGTFGYFDPEYFRSRRFTTKSDVYSFGVVLLETITSKPAVDETEGTTHLSQWVALILAEGEVTQIIDPKLGVDYDLNSVNKAVQLALACLSESSSQRPTMHQVVEELTDCLEIELARAEEITRLKLNQNSL